MRYDMRCYFNMRSIAVSLNYCTEPKTIKWKTENISIGKQSVREISELVLLEKKRKAYVGKICRKGRF